MLNHLSLILWISSDLLREGFRLVSSLLVVSGRLSIMAAHTEPWITIHDTTKENPNHYSSLSQISSLFFFLTQTKNIWKKNLRSVGCNAYAGFPPSCRLLGYLFLCSILTFDSFSAGADCSSHSLNKRHAYTLVKFPGDGCQLNHDKDLGGIPPPWLSLQPHLWVFVNNVSNWNSLYTLLPHVITQEKHKFQAFIEVLYCTIVHCDLKTNSSKFKLSEDSFSLCGLWIELKRTYIL